MISLLTTNGGWPVLGTSDGGNWEASKFDIVNILKLSAQFNIHAIVEIITATDFKNTNNRIIYVSFKHLVFNVHINEK